MNILIAVATVRKLVEAMGDDSHLLGAPAWQAMKGRAKRPIELSISELDVGQLTKVRDILKDCDEEITPQVSKLINLLSDPTNRACTDIEAFPKMLKAYLEANGNPLLFEMDAELRGVSYLPIECEVHHHHDNSYRRTIHDKTVSIKLAYNTKFAMTTRSLSFGKNDMRRTIPELLRHNGLMVPDASQLETNAKIIKRFQDYGSRQAEQFLVKGNARKVMGRGYWWENTSIDLSPSGSPTKAVMDLDNIGRDQSRATMHSDIYERSCKVPTHPVLPMFSLAHHETVWVNVANIKPYKYEEDIADKLILPKSHMRLINALVSNLDALKAENESEDKSRTIRAKAGSSVILAKGKAGTGKTLTAEVYAEIKQRPLYEVQSGQIGTDPEVIESNLNVILQRSTRLNMPLLINEADVFIQARGRDMLQNAVVSVFLRLLEYHNGLVFLTTNRSEDIDDAILSRCIAEIQYEIPKPPERLKLWRVMLKEFNQSLATEEVRKAVLLFPTVVGRDIQNLIRLTSRVCLATEEPFSLQALRENAIFKGIKVLTDKELDVAIEEVRAANAERASVK